MWIQQFLPYLGAQLGREGFFGHPVQRWVVHPTELRLPLREGRGRVRIEHRYPQPHFLVEAGLYQGNRLCDSRVRRFVLPRPLLMLLRLGGDAEGPLSELAAEVASQLR